MMSKVAVLAGLALVAGCGGERPAGPPAANDAASQAQVFDREEPGLAKAVPVSPGKPGAAVGLSYDLQGRPEVGVAVPLELVFQSGAQVQALQAVITGMDGLALQGELQAGFEPVSPGQQYRHAITVTPERAGVFYLTVVIEALHAGGELPEERTFSIPFVVGDAPVERKPAPASDAAGETAESPPAQE